MTVRLQILPASIHFDPEVRAFGADYSSMLPEGLSEYTTTISLDTGESFSFAASAYPFPAFFGFISPTPVKQVVFSDGAMFPGGMHEEMIGEILMVFDVPEPANLALLGGVGAFSMLIHGRRRTPCTE